MNRIRSSLPILVFLVVLTLAGTAQAGAVVGTNFTSSTYGVNSGFYPPDTMGSVGPSHIVELINGRFAVYSKTGVLAMSSSLDTFWTAADASPSGAFSFDPRILYDASVGRWYASSVDNAGGANNFLFAISTSSDPTAEWNGFKIDSDPTDTNWADYPTMGYDSGAVYLAANMFPIASGSTQVDVIVLPKADLLSGSVGSMTGFYNQDIGATDFHGFAIQPAVDLDGGGMPTPLIADYSTPSGFFATSTVTGTPAAPVLGTGVLVAKPAYGDPGPAAQMGSATGIEPNDNRISGNAVLVGGNLWVTQAVDVSGRSAVLWMRFDSTGTVLLESGLITDPSMEYYFPSIAVNAFGDVVIGFTGSDSSTYASAYAVVGKLSGGTTTFDTPMLLKAGVAPYVKLDSSSRNRWGDYSATVVDPSNPFAFWTFQEWASATNTWSTQVTQILITSPTPIPEPGTMFLMGVGALLLGSAELRRRRRRA